MAREFIEKNRHIFRYNYSPLSVPLLEFEMQWSKEYVFLESPGTALGGGDMAFGDHLYGLVTTTYPSTHGGWSIICDHLAARLHPKVTWLSLGAL